MQIHRVKKGETVYSISREYGVSAQKIIEINGLKNPDSLAVGRELLIMIPTRTYTARRGDTLDTISKRFSVRKSELIKNNPALCGGEKIYPEQIFAVKYPEKSHGIALLNGYLYKGCTISRLKLVLPYLSRLTLSECVYERRRLHKLFDSREAVRLAKAMGKGVSLRIYSREPYSVADFDQKFISMATDAARSLECDGITLSAVNMLKAEDFSDFLFELKKALMEADLTLSLESNGKIDEKCALIADSLILTEDLLYNKGSSFSDVENLYKDYAKSHETTLTYADLSPFAYKKDEAIPIDAALEYADKNGLSVSEDENGHTMSFEMNGETVTLPSLKSIKAKFDLTCELGYLGFSVDVMRLPISHLMMLSGRFELSPDYFSGGM